MAMAGHETANHNSRSIHCIRDAKHHRRRRRRHHLDTSTYTTQLIHRWALPRKVVEPILIPKTTY